MVPYTNAFHMGRVSRETEKSTRVISFRRAPFVFFFEIDLVFQSNRTWHMAPETKNNYYIPHYHCTATMKAFRLVLLLCLGVLPGVLCHDTAQEEQRKRRRQDTQRRRREQRDKWRETTAEMRKQVTDRKVQCTGLKTRVELFQKEIASHDVAIAELKSKLKVNDTAVAEIEDVKKELTTQQDNKDAFNKTLLESSQLLKEKKDQSAGLETRLALFHQQLKERMDRMSSTEARIKEKTELYALQIESLQTDLQAQCEQREKWTSTTNELKTLLEEKESQCTILSSELELLTTLKEV